MNRNRPSPIANFPSKGNARTHRRDSQSTIGNWQLEIGNRHSPFAHSTFGNRQSAFSFIEVLFAVILLGIGFIMIAGIFPVAIQQTAAVSNETAGTLVTRDAIHKIQEIAGQPGASALFTPNAGRPIVQPIAGNLLTALGDDVFYSADRRFAWMGFYQRDSLTNPFAQVFVIALQNPNFQKYQPNPTTMPSGVIAPPLPSPPFTVIGGNGYGLGPQWSPTTGLPIPTATVKLTYDIPSANSAVVFAAYTPNAVTGAYMLVCDDGGTLPVLNGRLLRLGAETTTNVGSAQRFALQPGFDLIPAPPGTTVSPDVPPTNARVVNVYIVGRAPTPPPAPAYSGDFTGPYTGPNQDIAASSAFIRVNLSNN